MLTPWPAEVVRDAGEPLRARAVSELDVRVETTGEEPADGYSLTVRAGGADVRAGGAAGAAYALETLRQLARVEEDCCAVPAVTIRDRPHWPVRGVIEGFYGPPWSQAERLDMLAFCRTGKFNTFVYAPKDDPFHRDRWRDPYPTQEARRLGELARAARVCHVEFVWAVAPGLSVAYAAGEDFDALAAKAAQLWDAGVRRFALLFDDIPVGLLEPRDLEAFARSRAPAAAAQATLANRFLREFVEPRGAGELLVVPVEYAGNGRSPYRDTLAGELDARCALYWTGPDVVPRAISHADAVEASAAFRRDLLLWENYPVNDFDRERLFLGPLLGRSPELAEAPLLGLTANPMLQAEPSKLALSTCADFAWNPAAYEPERSFRAALRLHGSGVRRALAQLAGEERLPVRRPRDVAELVEALRPGVDAATGAALLEPFVPG